jgi:hypothetical protein
MVGKLMARDSTHLDALANATDGFRMKVEKISFGARDDRKDMLIIDDGVAHLANAFPNLKTLRMDAAVLITGRCIFKVLQACPNMTSLSVTGNERRLDSIDLDNLTSLATDPVVSISAPKLKNLDLRRAIGADQQDYYKSLAAVTRPESRKGMLEVQFQHPTVHWEKTFKNGTEKRQRIPGGRENYERFQEALEIARYGDSDDDAVSMTKSELSILTHS